MAVDPKDVVLHACFVTSTNQVRKVVAITADDRVEYLSRGSSYQRGESSWSPGTSKTSMPLRSDFATEVERKVACSWDPNYPEAPVA